MASSFLIDTKLLHSANTISRKKFHSAFNALETDLTHRPNFLSVYQRNIPKRHSRRTREKLFSSDLKTFQLK